MKPLKDPVGEILATFESEANTDLMGTYHKAEPKAKQALDAHYKAYYLGLVPEKKNYTESTHSTVRGQLEIMHKQYTESGFNAAVDLITDRIEEKQMDTLATVTYIGSPNVCMGDFHVYPMTYAGDPQYAAAYFSRCLCGKKRKITTVKEVDNV